MFLSVIFRLLVGALLGGILFLAFGFIAVFLSDNPSFWAYLGLFIGVCWGLLISFWSFSEEKCPKCKNAADMIDKKDLINKEILPNTFTDNKGKVRTEYIKMVERIYFYQCPECGYQWKKTSTYRKRV